MTIKTLIAAVKKAFSDLNINFDTGTSYHLNQKINNDEDFTDVPYVYLFRPIQKGTSRLDESSPIVNTYPLNFAYFHKVETDENSIDFEEAQEAGDAVMYRFVDKVVEDNDLISSTEFEGSGFVKYFDSYVGRSFTITLTTGNDFDYCE